MKRREIVEWREVAEQLPDDDHSVLIQYMESATSVLTWVGWHEPEGWFVADGGLCEEGQVLRWAELPKGEATA